MRSLLIALLGAATFSAQAGYIDSQNHEWLHLEDSAGFNLSWDEVASVCDPVAGSCTGSLSYLGRELDLAGYQWALRTEVASLLQEFTNAPVALLDGDYTLNPGTALDFVVALTNTLGDPSAQGPMFTVSNGFTRDAYGLSYVSVNTFDGLAIDGRFVNAHSTLSDNSFGVWAYRSASVPEPPIALLLLLTLPTIRRLYVRAQPLML